MNQPLWRVVVEMPLKKTKVYENGGMQVSEAKDRFETTNSKSRIFWAGASCWEINLQLDKKDMGVPQMIVWDHIGSIMILRSLGFAEEVYVYDLPC